MNINTMRQTAAERYIERIVLPSEPLRPMWNRENFLFRKEPKWNYIDSCMIRAVIMHHTVTGRDELRDYAVRFTDAYVDENGDIPTFKAEQYNLDNICGGRKLLWLYRELGEERYLRAAEKLYGQLVRQPRLTCGCYWHKAIYPHQVWLDGAYMALPFLTEYGIMTGKEGLIGDAVSQLRNIRNIMRDPDTGLYYHGYDEKRSMLWADPDTGLSSEFWLRSLGWLAAGLADICELIPQSTDICDMLGELIEALERFRTPDGMLLQLPARPSMAGNYPETSGTLLISYAALKADRLGITGSKMRDSAEKALNTVTERFISYDRDGMPVLKNICLMAGLGGMQQRDGSAGYYLSERMTENDAKGVAPYLMAVSELMR